MSRASPDLAVSPTIPLVPRGDPLRVVAILPVPPTPFVGRERELGTVLDLLGRSTTRLLTLTGPGGVGKTRLALRAAELALASFPDGAVFVALAQIVDPDLVPASIGQALDIREGAGRPALDQVIHALRGRRLLLILDNCEHLLDAAPTVAALISRCPHLKVLVTSRIPLHLMAEQEFAVPPLSLPLDVRATDLAALAENEAIRLFLQRAGTVAPSFALTETNAETVAEICRRLDGLPLAIELAAARSKVLAPDAILARLDHSLQLLVDGPRDQPSRLRSVRDTVAWSYSLLDQRERRLFRRLAIFRDGFVLDAANAVAGDSTDVFDGVASLLNKSLLSAVGAIGGEPRFGMLETVREYALEQLVVAGEFDEVRYNHARWCLAFAERAEPALFQGPDQSRWLARLAAESANLRVALAALLDTDPEAGLCLAAALPRFWFIRGRLSEGRTWLEQALDVTDGAASRIRAKAWADLCQLASFQEDFARAGAAGEEAERLSAAADDSWSCAYSQGIRGYQALLQGDFPDAIERSEASLALWVTLEGDDRSTVARNCLATAAYALGRLDESAQLADDCLAHARRIGDDFGVAIALQRVGTVAFAQGNYSSALIRFAEALHRFADLGAGWAAAYALDGVASAAGASISNEQAARLLGAAAHQRTSAGVSLSGPLRVAHERAVATVRSSLSGPVFAAAWNAGETLSLEAAIAEADLLVVDNERSSMAPHQLQSGLTEREVDVLRLAVSGLTGPQTAKRLFLSPRTVQTHMAAIYRKLDVNTRGEAVRLAIERGLV